MTPHEAICHLTDAFRMALGEKRILPRPRPFKSIVRIVALYAPVTWPHNIQTLSEVEQGTGGTPPVEFSRDRESLLGFIARFCSADPRDLAPEHPMFGRMHHREWGRWGYRHLDHHLRQFGV